eukprot:6707102-Heterocapsa_arctica.AAC.1
MSATRRPQESESKRSARPGRPAPTARPRRPECEGRPKDWVFVSANCNSWSSGQTMVDDMAEAKMKCDIITLQETRLFGPDQLGRARAWANKANLLLDFRAAVKTGPGILETSAGVAVGARNCIPTRPFKNEQ